MATTFTKIASSTVGSGGVASITFSSIPATYTDLCLKINARSTSSSGAAWNYIEVRPNGATTNGTWLQLFGNGSSAGSGNGSGLLAAYGNDSSATGSVFGNSETYLPNYASSLNKSMSNDAVTENNATSAIASFFGTLWSQTTAISSLTLVFNTGNFAEYSTATLYGISKT
jgi:hypothetical protein